MVLAAAVVTRRPEVKRVPPWAAALVAVLLLANVVSLVNASALVWGGRHMAITVYLLLPALWLSAYVDRPARRALLVAYSAAAAAAAALLGIRAAHAAARQGPFLAEGCCRAQGSFEDPNVFGPFLVPALLILLNEALEPRLPPRRARLLLAVAIPLLEFESSCPRAARGRTPRSASW